MTKKLTSQRTLTWQEQHTYQLWRINKVLRFLAWSVFGLAVAYVLNALAGRLWP